MTRYTYKIMITILMMIMLAGTVSALTVNTNEVINIKPQSAKLYSELTDIDEINQTNCTIELKDINDINWTILKPIKSNLDSEQLYSYDLQGKELLNPDTIYEYRGYCYDTTDEDYGKIEQFKTEEYTFEYEKVEFGSCPDTKQGHINMWILVSLFILLGMFGSIYKVAAFPLVSSFILIFSSLIMWGCGALFSYSMILIGMVFLLTGLSIRPLTK